MTKQVMEMQQLLYHLHSMSELLINHHRDLIDLGKLIHKPDDISEPLLTIADIVKEKTESCLEKLELLEVYFREADKGERAEQSIQ